MKVSNETEDRTNQQSTATATTNVTRLHRDRERYRQIIKQILFDLNFRSKLVGTQYLEEAIVVRCSFAQKTIRAMDIYKYVALHHSANPVNVERAIRNTLYDCYRHGELAKINKLFGTRIVNNAYPPTSSDFICEVASAAFACDLDYDFEIFLHARFAYARQHCMVTKRSAFCQSVISEILANAPTIGKAREIGFVFVRIHAAILFTFKKVNFTDA